MILIVGMFVVIGLRVRLVLENDQLTLNEDPLQIEQYQIQSNFFCSHILHLKNREKSWILLPVALEQLKRRGNPEILQRQLREKGQSVEALRNYLQRRGVRVADFGSVMRPLYWLGGIWAVLQAAALLSMMKHF